MSPETEPARRRTQDERRTATRQAILEAATDRLVEGGLDAVTIAGVAKSAGLSTGAVVHHFENKLQLILALTTHLSSASKDAVIESADPDLPIEQRVASMIQTIMEAVFDPRTRAQFELHTAARVDPAFAEELIKLNARNAEVYVADFAAALLEAQVEPQRVLAAMELSVCAAVGVSLLSMSGRDPAIEDRLAQTLEAHILAEVALAQADGTIRA